MSGCELRTHFAATAALAPVLAKCFSTEPAAAQPHAEERITGKTAASGRGVAGDKDPAPAMVLARTPR
jgi:hypothetical protein